MKNVFSRKNMLKKKNDRKKHLVEKIVEHFVENFVEKKNGGKPKFTKFQNFDFLKNLIYFEFLMF